MSEARAVCPLCARPVGSRHFDFCPRSRGAIALLQREPNVALVYPGKGHFRAHDGHSEVRGLNPGVPQVYMPKSRSAGGTPTGPTTWWTGQKDPRTDQPIILHADRDVVRKAAAEFLTPQVRFANLGRHRPEASA